MIENRFLIAVYFFGQFTTCWQLSFFKTALRWSSSNSEGLPLRRVSSMSKLLFLNFANHFLAVDSLMTPFPYKCKCPGLFQQLFGLDEKQTIAGVENVAFYPLDIPYVSLTNNKISKYSKRRSAQFFTVEKALSIEYTSIHFAK